MVEISNRYKAPALDKGLDILEMLAKNERPISLKELSLQLGKPSTQIYRMLDTLTRRGYVYRQDDTYQLSLKLFSLVTQMPFVEHISQISESIMRKLTHDMEQSCQLAVWDGGELVVINSYMNSGNWALSIPVGTRLGIYNTGSGFVMLAFQSAQKRQYMMNQHQLVFGETKPELTSFLNHLDQIKQHGFCSEASQTVEGAINISYPILNEAGFAMACLTVPYIKRIDHHQSPSLSEVEALSYQASVDIAYALGKR